MRPLDTEHLIAGDWGTSRLRLFLCRRHELLARTEGPGAAGAGGDAERIVMDRIAPWADRHGPLPIVLSGMVGSGLGWKEVPHRDCPMGAAELAGGLHRFVASGHPVAIVPGLRCTNPFGAPDLMRGEETQIIGELAGDEDLAIGRRLLCLPGTHTKWVELDSGVIIRFLTGFSGELFSLLRGHSVLVERRETADDVVDEAFLSGVERGRAAGRADLLHLLFEVRARVANGELPRPSAASFLSGLIVGRDITGALAAFDVAARGDSDVRVIGSTDLVRLYAMALEALGVTVRMSDGETAALRGLHYLHQHERTSDDGIA